MMSIYVSKCHIKTHFCLLTRSTLESEPSAHQAAKLLITPGSEGAWVPILWRQERLALNATRKGDKNKVKVTSNKNQKAWRKGRK